MEVGITKPVKVNANALVTNSKGEILLTRLKVGHFAGSLCIPGGGVQLGELSHEAARREVFEETGIKVEGEFTHYGFCELMNAEINQHKIVMLLHAKGEGTPIDTEEGTGGWYTYEAAEKDMLAFAKEAIRIFNEKRVHFALTKKQVDIRDYHPVSKL